MVERNNSRILPIIPKKVGTSTLKKHKTNYTIINSSGEEVGILMIPQQMGTYYSPNWAVFQGNTLLEVFATLPPALLLIQKRFDLKKKKKKD